MRLYSQLSIPRHSLRDVLLFNHCCLEAKLSLPIPLKSDQTYPTIQSQLNSFFFSFGERPQFVNFYLQGEKVIGEFIGNVVMLVLVLKYCFKHISYMDWGQPNMETPILFFPHPPVNPLCKF